MNMGDREQDHPQEKEKQKSKMAVWGGLSNTCEKKVSEKHRIERDTCTPMFIAALFIIARTWKQPKCPSADE